jgi:magnesium transporter
MLRSYTCRNDRLVLVETSSPAADGESIVWFDLLNPTPEEDHLVERRLGVSVPTRDEMEEIELSARLYHEGGAEYMTMTAVTKLDTDEPVKTPISFILKGASLVTVRYMEPKAFAMFATRAQRPGGLPCASGEQVMAGLLETAIDRIADALETVGTEVDGLSREVFRNKASSVTKKTRDLRSVIEQIGRKGDFLTMISESLVSIARHVAYYTALDTTVHRMNKEARQRAKLVQRDVAFLSDHATFLSSKITFLLDATLGLINLEQSQTIKIFSVAAVVFLPPTLVASIYGMNFEQMPELQWLLGYPWALGLMLFSAILPYLYFKRRGWL